MNQECSNRLEIILNHLEDIQSDIKEILDEEEHFRDNLPKGEQHEQADAVCDDLSDAMDGLEDAVNSILSAITE